MATLPPPDGLAEIIERYPALTTAIHNGQYWRLDGGGVAFSLHVPSKSQEAIDGFEALADLLDMPLDHLSADEPQEPPPPGPSLTFDEFVGRPPRGANKSGPIWSGLTYPSKETKGRGWKPSP